MDPQTDWAEDVFEVGCLGPSSATGTARQGLLRSVPGACAFRGRAVDFTAYWTLAEDGGIEPGVVAAAFRDGGPRMDDDELWEVRELVEEALRGWAGCGDAAALAAENARRDAAREEARQAGERDAVTGVRAGLADFLAGGPGSIAEVAEAIRAAAEAERAAARAPS